ncbi:MAG TPA: acyl-CoA dehydrogenase family protein, partial [Mycobacterium sp.]
MNLELTDEQVALRDTVRRYLSEKASVSDHVRTMLDDPTGTTDSVWHALVALGTTSLLIPADRGGDAMSMVEAGLVCEELGAALHPGPWVSSAVLAPRALTRFGADGEQVDELFAGIGDGSVVATVAVPPRDGTSFAAERHDHGVIVRGEITPVPDAAAADILLAVGSGAELYAIPLRCPEVRIDTITGIDKSRKMFR